MNIKTNKKNNINIFDVFNEKKDVGSIVNTQYLKKLGIKKNNKISKKVERIIEDDITQWFKDNYNNLKPTLDYLKDK